jgi:hypothetical protein
MRYWITGDSVERVIDKPVRVLHRLPGTKCVALLLEQHPVIALLDWFTGQHADIFRLPPGAAVSATVLAEDRQRMLLVLQFVGRRWDLFDLYLLNVANRTTRLLRTNITCPLKASSQFAPRLPVTFLDEQTVAFVEAATTRGPNGSVLESQYDTVIVKLSTNRVLQRQVHPTSGLASSPPDPYLPPETLARLGLRRPPTAPVWPSSPGGESASEASGDTSWQQFLEYRSGRLYAADGTSFAPEQIDMFRISPAGSVLAARIKKNAQNPQNKLLAISQRDKRCYSFPLKPVAQMYWLGDKADR